MSDKLFSPENANIFDLFINTDAKPNTLKTIGLRLHSVAFVVTKFLNCLVPVFNQVLICFDGLTIKIVTMELHYKKKNSFETKVIQ